MSDYMKAEDLIAEMLADPQKFDKDGAAYELLQSYFQGYPAETLRPLLRSDNAFVRKAAAFIASELGAKAADLVDDVVPLLNDTDRYVQSDAMDVLAVCCTGPRVGKYVELVKMTESKDPALQAIAKRLVERADDSQAEVARRYRERTST
jgi:HEAT repeat protein